mgnify:FL=1|jgi:N-acetylglucosaminylphosphatidylinositol deacetylase
MGNFDKDGDSSFSYTSFFGGCKLLVIVPHQDDEINVAGSTIIGSIEEGLDVSLAFMTNGDWEYDVPLRNNEAIDAAKILGLSSQNIYFLDYPDCGYDTYSVYEHKDSIFSYRNRNISWEILLQDIEHLIVSVQPHSIICTGFDSHRDHRQCEEAVLTVMKKLWKSGSTIRLYTTFAYGNAYESIDDWRSIHWCSSVMNPKSHPEQWSTPSKELSWESRLRIPIPKSCRGNILIKNPIYLALTAHASQAAYRHSMQLINSDQVYWYRGPYLDKVVDGSYYLQILVNQHFSYDWLIYKGEKRPYISAYLGNFKTGKELSPEDSRLVWYVNDVSINNCTSDLIIEFMYRNNVDKIRLRCELKNDSNVQCECILRKGACSDWIYFGFYWIKDWLLYKWDHHRRKKKYKKIRQLRRLFNT